MADVWEDGVHRKHVDREGREWNLFWFSTRIGHRVTAERAFKTMNEDQNLREYITDIVVNIDMVCDFMITVIIGI